LVDESKYKVLSLADYYLDHFTTDPEEAGFIQVIKKSQINEKLSDGAIVLVPTGLCNCASLEIEQNFYVKNK